MKSILKRTIDRALDRAGYKLLHSSTVAALQSGSIRALGMKMRPVLRIDPETDRPQTSKLDRNILEEALGSSAYRDVITPYFFDYPAGSIVSAQSRALLFLLIRMLKPQVVVEIGTYYCGTTEVMARALWENGSGVVHTTDPFGGHRCPDIIASWPAPIRKITHFHEFNSMRFLDALRRGGFSCDIVLIDGDHSFECALFDLQYSANMLVRPGGLVILDNAEQTGPFQAARSFLAANPSWRELGDAIAQFDPVNPMRLTGPSIPNSSFLVLQAPVTVQVGSQSRSWGQNLIKVPCVDGISVDISDRQSDGTLHYQAILRSFTPGKTDIGEYRRVGSRRIVDGDNAKVDIIFAESAALMPGPSESSTITLEVELAWIADRPGQSTLGLRTPPKAYASKKQSNP